jgi:hypothetical protein
MPATYSHSLTVVNDECQWNRDDARRGGEAIRAARQSLAGPGVTSARNGRRNLAAALRWRGGMERRGGPEWISNSTPGNAHG